jgi:putative tryptophan/tyrosine transport system substrate-binding protein
MFNKTNTHRKSQKPATALILVIVFALLLSACGPAQTPKVYRVGILAGVDFFAATTDGFKAGMTKLGYIEGENIVYDVQKTKFDPAAEEKVLKKFVADKVDLIFVFPTEASIQAKAIAEGTNIPVLFSNANIEDTGLVNSVREPGGNITGVRYPGPDLVVKSFEVLLEIAPQVKRVLVPYKRGYPIVASQLAALAPAAQAAGVTIVEAPADDLVEMQAFLDAHAQSADIGFDAIMTIPEVLLSNPDGFTVVAKFAYEHKLPIGGLAFSIGEYATIFGVSTDNFATGEQAAPLADKILKGVPAGTIPVASAESFLQINVIAARALGVTVPDGLLTQASEVIR